MGELLEMMGFLLSPLILFAVMVAVVTAVGRGSQGGQRPPYKATSPMDPASRTIRRAEARMERLDVQHQREDCTFSYTTQDPNFSFNGRQVVDELAELRRKNAAHERHLLARVHRD